MVGYLLLKVCALNPFQNLHLLLVVVERHSTEPLVLIQNVAHASKPVSVALRLRWTACNHVRVRLLAHMELRAKLRGNWYLIHYTPLGVDTGERPLKLLLLVLLT